METVFLHLGSYQSNSIRYTDLKQEALTMIENNIFRFKWWALLGVSLLAFTGFLDATIVNTALPFIQTDLNTNILQLQWVANVFPIILAMTMIATGKLADLWGRKRVFYFGVIVFAIAAIGCGLSSTVEMLIFFRALQAIGASIIFITSAALLSDIFPENERVRAISIYGGMTGFGLMIGPFLGGILIELFNWRWVFWINIPLIALGLAACSFSLNIKQHRKLSIKIDKFGLALLIFGLGALMYGIIAGAHEGWSSITAWLLLAVGLIGLTLLVTLDKSRKNPLLDLEMFKEKIITLAALACALGGVVSTVFMFFDPLYLRILRDLSPFMIGALVAVIPAAQALISFFFASLLKKFGTANLLLVSVLAAFIAAVLHRFIGEQTPLLFLMIPFFFLGINWGLANAAMITSVNQTIAPHKIGEALGTISTIWNIVGAIMLALSTAVFYAIEIHASFLPAFRAAIDINIAFAGILLIVAIVIRRKLEVHQA